MSEWKILKIDNIKANISNAIAMGPFGSRIKSDNFVDSGVPVIRGVNLKNGRFDESEFVFLTEEKAQELKSSLVYPDDIIFTHRGTLGQVGIIPKNGKYKKYIISQSQMKLTCNKEIVEPLYVYYYFKSPKGQYELLKNTNSTGVPAIASPSTTLRSLEIPIPDLKTQKRIISILSGLDDKIELNLKMNQTLEEMAMTLYKHWFVDFGPFQDGEFVESELGMIPKGWEIKKLSDIVEIRTTSINPSKTPGEFYYHYSIPAYDEGKLPSLDSAESIKSNKYLIETDTVLVSKLNPTTPRIWTVYFKKESKNRQITSTEFIHYVPKQDINFAWLNCYLRSDDFQNEFKSNATGTTHSRQRVSPKVTKNCR